jgi:thiamine pyrophosphate-dependent acetolactate synthase large subunit-like protein
MNPKVLQVDSDSNHELQSIAAALSLAKKVVVVIGAGVSTAANIPVC